MISLRNVLVSLRIGKYEKQKVYGGYYFVKMIHVQEAVSQWHRNVLQAAMNVPERHMYYVSNSSSGRPRSVILATTFPRTCNGELMNWMQLLIPSSFQQRA